jgi:hypothetical protein
VPVQRENTYTAKFSAAAESVAKRFNVPFLNMYERTTDWQGMLVDGLHFTAKGNHLLFQQLLSTISTHYPALQATGLPLDGFPFLEIEGKTAEEVRAFYMKQGETAQAENKP